jgi:hypothetical protein
VDNLWAPYDLLLPAASSYSSWCFRKELGFWTM